MSSTIQARSIHRLSVVGIMPAVGLTREVRYFCEWGKPLSWAEDEATVSHGHIVLPACVPATGDSSGQLSVADHVLRHLNGYLSNKNRLRVYWEYK